MMNTRAALCIILAYFLCGAYGAKLTFNNKCPYTVWPGTSASGQNQLSKTGFELASGESTSLNVPSPWEGQFWARTGCSSSSDKFTCTTGDCGSGQVTCHGARALPPATTAELSVAANRGNDIYAITNVNGFNVPMSIAPRGGIGECKLSICAANINEACPAKLRVKGNDGKVVGCNSACVAFNEAKYCCTGEFESPELCKPSEYALFFKKKCPLAYTLMMMKAAHFHAPELTTPLHFAPELIHIKLARTMLGYT